MPNVPVHMIVRGNSRPAVFAENDDYFTFRNWLKEASEQYGGKWLIRNYLKLH